MDSPPKSISLADVVALHVRCLESQHVGETKIANLSDRAHVCGGCDRPFLLENDKERIPQIALKTDRFSAFNATWAEIASLSHKCAIEFVVRA